MNYLILGAIAALSLFTGAVSADSKAIEAALKQELPSIKPDSITESPVKGLYEVVVGARLFYVSEDGKFLVHGSVMDLKTREDLSDRRLATIRLKALEKVGLDNMIVFKPKIQKHYIYVFTDIDCGYCRKLHSQVEDYLREGIEVRYLFFPRAGKDSDSYHKAVTVWCAKDRNAALTRAKNGETFTPKTCKNPVDEHMALAQAFGANGTPMIVTDKGAVIPGYVPAKELVKELDGVSDEAASDAKADSK
jgi:thiol:disulfide interchange protein DsbC